MLSLARQRAAASSGPLLHLARCFSASLGYEALGEEASSELKVGGRRQAGRGACKRGLRKPHALVAAGVALLRPQSSPDLRRLSLK